MLNVGKNFYKIVQIDTNVQLVFYAKLYVRFLIRVSNV